MSPFRGRGTYARTTPNVVIDEAQEGEVHCRVEHAFSPGTKSNGLVATLHTDVKTEHLERIPLALCHAYVDLAMTVKATSNNKVIGVFFDTGAGANVISLQTLKALYNNRKQANILEPPSVKITG